MWTEGQTDMTKLIVAFRNFAKAAKKVNLYIVSSKPHFYRQSIRLEVRITKQISAEVSHKKFQHSLSNGLWNGLLKQSVVLCKPAFPWDSMAKNRK